MFANVKTVLAVASCALFVHAQSTTNTTTAPASQSSLPAGVDACILGCVGGAAVANGCVSFTNVSCVCTSTAFQQAAQACLKANCTADDLTAANQLQTQECASLNSSTASATPTTSSGTSATGTSAAMALSAPFSFASLVGTLIASAGVLVGAALVL